MRFCFSFELHKALKYLNAVKCLFECKPMNPLSRSDLMYSTMGNRLQHAILRSYGNLCKTLTGEAFFRFI